MDEYLFDQIQAKALLIAKTLYLKYGLLFIFNNTISHVVYAKNILHVAYINKSLGGQQLFYKQANTKGLIRK